MSLLEVTIEGVLQADGTLQLDEKPGLAPGRVTVVLRRVEEQDQADAAASRWPEGYFQQTAGALAGEEFERPLQGDLPVRDDW